MNLRQAAPLLAILVLGACAEEPPPRPPVEVVVDAVVLDDFQPKTSYVGRLQAINDVAIQARVNGYVLSRDFREGDLVQEGDLLYTIDPSEYQAALERAKADLAGAVARQANALRTYKRGLELVSKGAISQAEMDKFEADKLETDAQIEAAKAQVDSAEVNLAFTTIKAPITGRTGLSAVSVGDLVGPNTGDLTNLVSLDPMEAQFQISESLYISEIARRVNDGIDEASSRVDVTLELADGSMYEEMGAIDYVGNRVDMTTGTLDARARIPNPESILVPGQYVRIVLRQIEKQQALFVPQAAVQSDQQGSFVMVVEQGSVARRGVVLGDRLDDKVIVIKGVRAGESVIVQGLQQVRPGMPVQARSVGSVSAASAANGQEQQG